MSVKPAHFSREQWHAARQRVDRAQLAHLTIRDATSGQATTLSSLVTQETAEELIKAFVPAGEDLQMDLPL